MSKYKDKAYIFRKWFVSLIYNSQMLRRKVCGLPFYTPDLGLANVSSRPAKRLSLNQLVYTQRSTDVLQSGSKSVFLALTVNCFISLTLLFYEWGEESPENFRHLSKVTQAGI